MGSIASGPIYHCTQQYNGEYGGRQVSFTSSEIDHIEQLRYRNYVQERGESPFEILI